MSDALREFYFELGQLKQRAQSWKDRALAAEQEKSKLIDRLDLMIDEFKRIRALEFDCEINALCDRAIAWIEQDVPVITQRDKAEQERDQLKAELQQVAFKIGDFVKAFDSAVGEVTGFIKSIDDKGYSMVARFDGKYLLWANFEGFKRIPIPQYSDRLRAILERIEKEKKQ